MKSLILPAQVCAIATLVLVAKTSAFSLSSHKGLCPQQGTFSGRHEKNIHSFIPLENKSTIFIPSTRLLSQFKDEDDGGDDEVKVGTKEYYKGFISRDLQESEERVTGDKVLIPTLKFVGGFAFVIGLLLVGFLSSNGII